MFVLFWPGTVRAFPEGPPGDTTGDSATRFEGLIAPVEVGEFSGTATFRHDFAVPPGRSDFQPDLALAYAHGRPASIYGEGWDLNLPRVQRSTRLGAPAFNSNDSFDVLLEEDVAEFVAAAPNLYGARRDESSAKLWSEGLAWKLRRKDGRVYTFGGSATARAERPGSTGIDDVFSWHVTQIEDPSGNYITINYTKPGDGYVYPNEIQYGANVFGASHAYKITFVWVDRANPISDVTVSYMSSFRQAATKQLERIIVSTIAGARVSEHEFSWSPSLVNGRPLLESIQLEGSDGLPLQDAFGNARPTRFEYSTHLPAQPQDDITTATQPLSFGHFRRFDPCVTRAFVDINGDGRADLVRNPNNNTNDGEPQDWLVQLNTGATDGSPVLGSPQPWPAPDRCLWFTFGGKVMNGLADVDGDGVVEYVQTGAPWWVWRRNAAGTGFESSHSTFAIPSIILVKTDAAMSLYEDESEVTGQIITFADLVDYTGDGRLDYVVAMLGSQGEGLYGYKNLGSGFSNQAVYLTEGGNDPHAVRINAKYQGSAAKDKISRDTFDINGDGLADHLHAIGDNTRSYCTESGKHWIIYFGTGGEMDGPYCWLSPPMNYLQRWGNNRADYDLIDINGDGLPDMVDARDWVKTDPNKHFWKVYYNTGNGFLRNPDGTLKVDTIYSPEPLRSTKLDSNGQPGALDIGTFDVTGNGYPDTVNFDGTDAHFQLRKAAGYQPNLLVKVTNPLLGTVELDYAVATTFNLPSVSDNQNSFPRSVVIRRTSTDTSRSQGLAGVEEDLFTYEDGVYDTVDREFDGFRVVRREDIFGVFHETEYHQTPGLHGKPHFRSVYEHNPVNGTLWTETLSWTVQNQFGPRYLPRLQSLVRVDRSSLFEGTWYAPVVYAGRSVMSEYDYDSCGNLTEERLYDSTEPQTIGTGSAELVRQTITPYDDHVQVAGSSGDCDDMFQLCDGICDRVASREIVDGPKEEFTYDASGHLLTRKRIGEGDPEWIATYDALGTPSTVTDPRGIVMEVRYDTDPGTSHKLYPTRWVADKNGKQHVTERNYDPVFGSVVRHVMPSGSATEYAYDSLGRLQRVAGPGQTLASPTKTYSYVIGIGRAWVLETNASEGDSVEYFDQFARSLQKQTIRFVGGSQAIVVHDAKEYEHGRVVSEYRPFTSTGFLTSFASVDGKPHDVITHDAFGREERRERPDGSATTISHQFAWSEGECDAVHENDPTAGRCVVRHVDALEQLSKVETFLGDDTTPYLVEDFGYTSFGAPLTTVQNNDIQTVTLYGYDALGRRKSIFNTSSGTWKFGYDANDNLVYRDDPKPNQHLEFEVDSLGRPEAYFEKTGDAYGQGSVLRETAFTYDTASGFGVGELNRVQRGVPGQPLESDVVYENYDARGNAQSYTRGIAIGTDYRVYESTRAFDAFGRRIGMTIPYPDADGHEGVGFVYNAAGQLDRIISDVAGFYIVASEFDAYARPTQIQYANGTQDNMVYYNPRGSFFGSPTPGRGDKLLAVSTVDTGTGAVVRGLTFSQFDAEGRVTAASLELNGAPAQDYLVATYDDAGRLDTWSAAGQTPRTYQHDSLGRIVAKDGNQYAYLTTKPFLLATVGGTAVGYDANGNMTALPGGPVVSFDADDRVAQVTSGGTTTNYVYDHNKKRIAATDGTEQRYYFDDFDIVDDTVVRHIRMGSRVVASSPVSLAGTAISGSGLTPPGGQGASLFGGIVGMFVACLLGILLVARRRFPKLVRQLHYAGMLTVFPLALSLSLGMEGGCVTLPAGTFFLHQDHIANVQMLTDEDGQILESTAHLPYGTATTSDAQGQPVTGTSAFSFTQHRRAEASGLVHMQLRDYSPSLGMFVSMDPARQYNNPYSYADGNPLNGVDRTGAIWLPLFRIALGVATWATAVSTDPTTQTDIVDTVNALQRGDTFSAAVGAAGAVIPAASGPLFRRVGEGAFSSVVEKPGLKFVFKQIKPNVLGKELTAAQRQKMAQRTAEVTQELRANGFRVPKTQSVGNIIVQEKITATPAVEFFQTAAPEAQLRGMTQAKGMIERARKLFPGQVIDPNGANFFFDKHGNAIWVDPVTPYDATPSLGRAFTLPYSLQ